MELSFIFGGNEGELFYILTFKQKIKYIQEDIINKLYCKSHGAI